MDPVAAEEFHRALLLTTARGHAQRATAETRASKPLGDSALANHLMTEWGYGSHSAQETQKLARLAHRAGAYGGYLAELSALGTNGDNPQNCSTELMALIRKGLGTAVLPIYVALVPFFRCKV